jgi:hypothetical protein
MLNKGFEHWLEQRKQHAAEQREIRAEQRERDKKEAERLRAEADEIENDEATLLMYKTQVQGCTELVSAANRIETFHRFFSQRPQYLNASNRAFLVKYPIDFFSQVSFNRSKFGADTLDELKTAVEGLRLVESRTVIVRPDKSQVKFQNP